MAHPNFGYFFISFKNNLSLFSLMNVQLIQIFLRNVLAGDAVK